MSEALNAAGKALGDSFFPYNPYTVRDFLRHFIAVSNGPKSEPDREQEHQWIDRHILPMMARVVLEAVREPTGDMIDAGAEAFVLNEAGQPTVDGQPSAAWRAMIDALLSDAQP